MGMTTVTASDKFKVGDRVIVVTTRHNYKNIQTGGRGIIISADDYPEISHATGTERLKYVVRFDDGWWEKQNSYSVSDLDFDIPPEILGDNDDDCI